MTIRDELVESCDIMEYLAESFFGNRCHVTHKEFERKGFAIHHLEERDGDILARDYKKKYGKRYRVFYLRALKEQFMTDPTLPERTVLIKNYVHARLDHYKNGVCKFPMEQRARFCDVAMKTKTVGRKRNGL